MNPELVAQWEKVQIKTFTKWTNMHLAKCGKSIESVTTGFMDGLNLIALLQVISGETIANYNKNPRMRIMKIENLNTALKFIADHNVKLVNIGSEDLVDGSQNVTLGMIWTIILRFAIADFSEEGLSAKQGLLLWVQKKTAGYKGVDVKDFSESFKDGLAFDALIHHHRPDLISFDDKDPNNAAANLDAAFDAAEKLGVPKLLDTNDIVSMPKPDEKSIMTYCAALYKVFSNYDKVDAAGKRLGKFITFAKQVHDMVIDYEERAAKLARETIAKNGEFASAPIPGDYHGIHNAIVAFKEYRKTAKRAWVTEGSDLSVLFTNIQSKLRMMGRPLYVPPQGLLPEDLDKGLTDLTTTEREYYAKLALALRQLLDKLRRDYAAVACPLVETLKDFGKFLAQECTAPIDEQPKIYQDKRQELSGIVEAQLPALEAAEKACDDANIDENEYCDETYDDIKFNYERLLSDFDKKILFANSQAVEAASGVSPDKMAEFRESFDTFNAHKGDGLDKLEFTSAVTSLGLVEVDFSGKQNTDLDALFDKVRNGEETVSFENWVNYMISISADACSKEQAAEQLAAIAGGKEWVTIQDLQNAHLPQEQIDFITEHMPKTENGYDYRAWIASF